MAPGGGRSRKRGLTRMDAALDNLVMYGFTKAAIRKKVNELLKVYGGPDGWVFIEESSYELVREALLEEGGGSQPGSSPILMDEAVNQDNFHGDVGSSSTAGPSNANEIPDPEMAQHVVEAEKTCADGDSRQDSAVTSMDDVSFTQYDITNNADDDIPPGTEPIPLEIKRALPPLPPPRPRNIVHAPLPPPPLPPSPPPQPELARMRRPCYGWWGEETDVILLPLMPIKVRGARRS